jgi:hypothetical protein
MKLSGLHLLLTYQCTLECDHCFVWGSPWQEGVMSLSDIHLILQQALDLGTVKTIFFEGGEPFLYYATLLQGAREAAALGFEVGIVSNGFWANTEEDALANLEPFAGLIQDLTVSSDLYHWRETISRQANNASSAARKLGIPIGVISIAPPEAAGAAASAGQLPTGQSRVMYRGRAAMKLAGKVAGQAWDQFTACPHEDLREPGRVHLDPLGYLHLCQGISPGNLFQTSLREICERYDPDRNPIVGPLLKGGPAELVRQYGLPHEETYADACHLCYAARTLLRPSFPQILAPDQMYGLVGG